MKIHFTNQSINDPRYPPPKVILVLTWDKRNVPLRLPSHGEEGRIEIIMAQERRDNNNDNPRFLSVSCCCQSQLGMRAGSHASGVKNLTKNFR